MAWHHPALCETGVRVASLNTGPTGPVPQFVTPSSAAGRW